MRDWLIDYGSWCLAPFGLAGMYVATLKKAWGWLLSMGTQALWAVYAVGTGQYGFLIGTVSYFAVYLNGYVSWTTGRSLVDRFRRRTPTAEPDTLARVEQLLIELNRLELEKDRDGSAEQPWWYMRDGEEGFAGVLGIRFPDELPDEDEEDAA